MKRSICVDFDRVLHSYTTPWTGESNISDPPIKGAFQWLTEMVQHFEVHLFSMRCNSEVGRVAMLAWFRKYGLTEEVIAKLKITPGKPSALLYIDDRSFQFRGRFPDSEEIKGFKPWHPDNEKDLRVESYMSVEEVVAEMSPTVRARYEGALIAARSGPADAQDTAEAHVLAYFLRHPKDAHKHIANALRSTVTGAMVLQALRHEVIGHLDVEQRSETLAHEFVVNALTDGEPLLHHAVDVVCPDGRKFIVRLDRVEE